MPLSPAIDILDEGVSQGVVSAFDFTGAGVSVSVSGNRATATIAGGGGVTDHGALTGLTDDDHSQYALLAGRSGGQELIGGTGASDNLTLKSTSNVTKGSFLFDTVGLIQADTEFIIAVNTADGSDNTWANLCGGGAAAASRGAYITVRGNEATGVEGDLVLAAGNGDSGSNRGSIQHFINSNVVIETKSRVGAPSAVGFNTAFTSSTCTDSSTAASGTASLSTVWSFSRPTIAASNSSVTHTDAATVYISNSPAAGSNITITSPWSLWVDDGNVRLDGSLGIGVAATPSRLVHLRGADTAIIRLENSDTTLAADQLMGGLEFYSNDGSNAGVGVKSTINCYAIGSTGGESYLSFTTATSSANNVERLRIDRDNIMCWTSSFGTSATYNFVLGGGATSPVLGAATADIVALAGVDNGAGNREFRVQPESGGYFAWGANIERHQATANRDAVVRRKGVTTTDATVTTVDAISITASSTYFIESTITWRRTGGTAGTADDGGSYVRRGTYTTKSGTVTLMGAVETIGTDAEDQAGPDATLDINTTNVRVRVTGALDNDISWFAETRVVRVAS